MKNKLWKRILKKNGKKIVERKDFETKILITKIYNTINQCDIIFALLPTAGTGKKTGSHSFLQGVIKANKGLGIVWKYLNYIINHLIIIY